MLEALPGDVSDRDRAEVVDHADEGHHSQNLQRDHHEGYNLICIPLWTAVCHLLTATAAVERIDARNVVQLAPDEITVQHNTTQHNTTQHTAQNMAYRTMSTQRSDTDSCGL